MSYKLMCSYVNDDREDIMVAIADTQDEAELLWIEYAEQCTFGCNTAYYIVDEE